MENQEYPLARFLRLSNGDDIIADTVELEDENGILYMVQNPLKVVYAQSIHQGYLSVSFIPWVFPRICDKQEFTIHSSDVLMISDVSQKMNEYYWGNLDTLEQKEEIPQEEPETPEESLLDTIKELTTKRTWH